MARASDNPADNRQNSGARSFLIAAMVSLLLMAFLWAADASFRYILAGLATWFLYLAFLRTSWRPTFPDFDPLEEIRADVRTIFSRPAFKSGTYSDRRGNPKIVLIALAFIGFVFFTIVLAVVSLSDDPATAPADEADVTYEDSPDEDNFRSILLSAPDDPGANLGLADFFVEQQSYDSALKYYDRVLRADPYNETVLYNKAMVKFYQKDYEGTLQAARSVINVNPGHQDALLLSGDSYYMRQSYDSALYWYDKAYTAGVRTAPLLHVMAYIHDTKGNRDRAVAYYREALQYDSTKTEIYERLGELFPGQEGDIYRDLAERYGASE